MGYSSAIRLIDTVKYFDYCISITYKCHFKNKNSESTTHDGNDIVINVGGELHDCIIKTLSKFEIEKLLEVINS